MSSSISTPDALSSDAFSLTGTCWRIVEGQHRISTLKLVETVDEQGVLEHELERTKPLVPPECRDFHYLLYTPFRYGGFYPGSRFRRAGSTEGVFYAAEKPETAIAEMVFHRLLFYVESPDTPWPSNAAEYTAFSVEYATKKAIDLTRGKYRLDEAKWTHLTDYGHCQSFAERARRAKVEVICSLSVRDPGKGKNLALLTCRAFARPKPLKQQTWRVLLSDAGALAVCESPTSRITFDRGCFATDPRIAKLRWVRGKP
jgi:RES domain